MGLSLGSIGLGLIAWIIPLIFISSIKKKASIDYGIYAIGSFTACAISIGLQFFEIKHSTDIGNFLHKRTVPECSFLHKRTVPKCRKLCFGNIDFICKYMIK